LKLQNSKISNSNAVAGGSCPNMVDLSKLITSLSQQISNQTTFIQDQVMNQNSFLQDQMAVNDLKIQHIIQDNRILNGMLNKN
jgi:hypothetical protein